MDGVRSGVVGESPADVDGALGLGCRDSLLEPTTTDGGGGCAVEEGNLWRVVPASELRWVGAAWLCSPV
jgi:hypothetical protein